MNTTPHIKALAITGLVWTTWAVTPLNTAWAAGHAAPGAAPATAHASAQPETGPHLTAYTSKAGDSLNKIVLSHYKGSPLQTAVLVKAVRQHNPVGLPARADARIKTGTQLHLPQHTQVMRDTLQAMQPQDASAAAPAPDRREHWVRFP